MQEGPNIIRTELFVLGHFEIKFSHDHMRQLNVNGIIRASIDEGKGNLSIFCLFRPYHSQPQVLVAQDSFRASWVWVNIKSPGDRRF